MSKGVSFSVSSCSSNDSIHILNGQVDHIREIKTEPEKKSHHLINSSIMSLSQFEAFYKDMKKKLSFSSWGSISNDKEIDQNFTENKKFNKKSKKHFFHNALIADLPTLKF